MDFTVIARAKLTQREFAALVGVSRVTANMWVRAKMSPHRYIRAKIATVLSHLEAALQRGDLPLNDAREKERTTALRVAVGRSIRLAAEGRAAKG